MGDKLDRWVSAKELAAFLGVSVETIRRLTNKGILPCVRVGTRAVRYNIVSCLKALQRHTKRKQQLDKKRRKQKHK